MDACDDAGWSFPPLSSASEGWWWWEEEEEWRGGFGGIYSDAQGRTRGEAAAHTTRRWKLLRDFFCPLLWFSLSFFFSGLWVSNFWGFGEVLIRFLLNMVQTVLYHFFEEKK